MKKVFSILFILIIVLGAMGGFIFYRADNVAIPTQEISIQVEGQKILPSAVHWNVDVLDFAPSFLTKKFVLGKNVAIDQVAQEIVLEGTKMEWEIPYIYDILVINEAGQEVFSSQEEPIEFIDFSQKGKYYVHVTKQIPPDTYGAGYGTAQFEFGVLVDPKVQILFDSDNIKQGDLVKVTLQNVFLDDQLEVQSDFKISAIQRFENYSEFYIPITYYKPAQNYGLTITINDVPTVLNYQVGENQFTEIHFTVDNSVTSTTVNSAAANQEYREKIHPLYYTRDPQKYWEGAFIKPVEETRISSTFGQKRYVNNATTPERHSGIDYAAPQGTPIYAPNAGKVEFAGFLKLSGYTIVIEHGLGLKSYYFHMNDVFVSAGDMVAQGDKIGEVGSTGYSTGPHLHFQISIENQPIDPAFLYEYAG